MSTPAEMILGFMGRGACTETAMVGYLLGRGYAYPDAVHETKEAITALARAGRIELFQGTSIYQVVEKGLHPTKRKSAAKSTDNADKTPILRHPCLDGDGQ